MNDRRACGVHEEYIQSIAILNNNIQWLTRLGKWVVATLVTVGIVIVGATITFSYKASEVYAQVQVNTKAIEHYLSDKKKEPTGG